MHNALLFLLAVNVLFVPAWCLSIARVKRLRALKEGLVNVFFKFIA